MRKFILPVVVIGLILAGYSAYATSEKQVTKRLEQVIEKLEKFEIPVIESIKNNPSSFFTGPQGQVRIISGTVTEIASTTPSTDGVKVWGLNLRVDRTGASYIPSGTTAQSLKVGDTVNIKGTINKDTGVITASSINLLPTQQQATDSLMVRIRELIVKIRELQQKFGLPLTPLP